MSPSYQLIAAMLLALLLLLALFPKGCREGFVNPRYSIVDLGTVLNAAECDAIIDAAQDKFARSAVLGGEPESEVRTSQTAWLNETNASAEAWRIVQKLRDAASAVLGVTDPSKFEDLQVVRYAPGQQYKAHFDSAVKYAGHAEKIRRRATLIVYLNEDFTGGETAFPKLDVRIKPRKGKGALFYNMDARGEEHAMSLHESVPVKRGIKYATQLWIKE